MGVSNVRIVPKSQCPDKVFTNHLKLWWWLCVLHTLCRCVVATTPVPPCNLLVYKIKVYRIKRIVSAFWNNRCFVRSKGSGSCIMKLDSCFSCITLRISVAGFSISQCWLSLQYKHEHFLGSLNNIRMDAFLQSPLYTVDKWDPWSSGAKAVTWNVKKKTQTGCKNIYC